MGKNNVFYACPQALCRQAENSQAQNCARRRRKIFRLHTVYTVGEYAILVRRTGAGEFLGDLQYVNKILHFQTPVSDTVCEAKSLRTAIYSLNP